LSLSKFVDKSTATLMSKCCDGSHIATGKLTLRKAGGNSPVEYLTVEMSEILVSSIQTGGSTGDDRQIEQLSLNFAKFTATYTPQKDDGSADVPIPVTWDIAANAAA